MKAYRFSELGEYSAYWSSNYGSSIPLGFSHLDYLTGGGISKGEFMLVLAQASTGKTTWMLNSICQTSGRRAVFFSIDMSVIPIYEKLAAMTNGLALADVTSPVPAELHAVSNKLLPNLIVIDRLAITTGEIGDVIKSYSADIAYIDFLGLVDTVNKYSYSQSSQVDTICRELRAVGQETDCAMVVAHQVSRSGAESLDAPLHLRSGYYGGEIHADYVVGLYRPHILEGPAEDTIMNIQLLKSRGKLGVDVSGKSYLWVGAYGRILENTDEQRNQQNVSL